MKNILEERKTAMFCPEPDASEETRIPESRPETEPGREQQKQPRNALIECKAYDFFYGATQALFAVDFSMPAKQVTAIIGPSGCGKSTLLRNINRMNELIDGVWHRGDILIQGQSIYDPELEVTELRKRVGMVFQKSNPFPKSVYENAVYSLRVAGQNNKAVLEESAERSLRAAALWDEVKDRLNDSALSLSGGQMQRLCIARAIANQPDILLMDEPCSALDPIATAKIEELIFELKKDFTMVIVTHNMQQAARVSDWTGFFYMGKLIEFNETKKIFMSPEKKQTEEYVTGRFG